MHLTLAATNLMTWELTGARALLLLHAVLGFGAAAITIHVLWFAWKRPGKGAAHRVRRYLRIAWPMYLAALVSGALVYPAYAVTVRKAWLEANRPAMVGLFEIKEHWAALGLLLAWGLWRAMRKPEAVDVLSPTAWRGIGALALLVTICLLLNVIAGTWIVMIRSV